MFGVINTYSQELVWLPWGCKDQTHVIWKMVNISQAADFSSILLPLQPLGRCETDLRHYWGLWTSGLRTRKIREKTGDRLQSWAKKGELQWFQLIVEIDGSIWILTGQQQVVKQNIHRSTLNGFLASPNLPKFRRQVNNITLCPQEMPSNSWTPLDGNSTVLWCSHMGGSYVMTVPLNHPFLIGCSIK